MQASALENAPAMKIALAEAAGRLGVQGAAPTLLAQLKSDPSFNVRVAALRALQALKVLEHGRGDEDRRRRRRRRMSGARRSGSCRRSR